MLKKFVKEGGSNSPRFVGSKDPKFASAPRLSTLKVQPQKKPWDKKTASKEKAMVKLIANISQTFVKKARAQHPIQGLPLPGVNGLDLPRAVLQ